MAHSTKIDLPSLINTRDLGGIKGEGGKTIKPKKIVRSGELDKADEQDIKALYFDYDVRTVIDLRNKTESIQKPDKIYKDTRYILNPILTETQMGMTHEEETDAETSEYVFVKRIIEGEGGVSFMKDLYLNFVDDPFCLSQYKKLVDYFTADHQGAILYHCSVGKDRVGIGTFIILKLLGASDRDIIEDFMLTNIFIEPNITKRISNLSKRIDDPRLEQTYRELFQVRKDYIEVIMKHIDAKYGSFDSFAQKGLGISQEEKATLQAKYLA
jgi:protein-tyrosine phosphatase